MKLKKGLLVLTGLWGCFIFANSLLPGSVSTQMSDSVVESLPAWTSGVDLHTLILLVRKSGHFLEYALLGLLACFSQSAVTRLSKETLGNVLFPCLLWAVLDEFLQTFVQGRSGRVSDILIDLGGILTGCLLAAVFLYWKEKRKAKKPAG